MEEEEEDEEALELERGAGGAPFFGKRERKKMEKQCGFFFSFLVWGDGAERTLPSCSMCQEKKRKRAVFLACAWAWSFVLGMGMGIVIVRDVGGEEGREGGSCASLLLALALALPMISRAYTEYTPLRQKSHAPCPN